MSFMKKKYFPVVFIFLLLNASCSLFFGNIKPSDEKSSTYRYLDLSTQTQNWMKWSDQGAQITSDSRDLSQSDISFRSKKSHASISINSVCKKNPQHYRQPHLKALGQELFLGLHQVEILTERNLKVSRVDAYEMTIKGLLQQTPLMMRVVLLQKDACSYDLIYISDPLEFKNHEEDFNRFVAAFELNP